MRVPQLCQRPLNLRQSVTSRMTCTTCVTNLPMCSRGRCRSSPRSRQYLRPRLDIGQRSYFMGLCSASVRYSAFLGVATLAHARTECLDRPVSISIEHPPRPPTTSTSVPHRDHRHCQHLESAHPPLHGRRVPRAGASRRWQLGIVQMSRARRGAHDGPGIGSQRSATNWP